MTPVECCKRISEKIETARAGRHTGKFVVEIDMNQGGISNATFYTSLKPINHRCSLFSGNNGPFLLQKIVAK